MGCIRLLLAISVILGHLSMYWQTEGFKGGLYPYYAVQIFFVISGFYISLILEQKYKLMPNGIKLFYLHRYLRLAPAYWLIGAITLILTILSPQIYPLGKILFANNPAHNLHDLWAIIVAGFANIFLFGLDITAFFSFHAHDAAELLVIPQSWSLGTEMCFYALSPLLVTLSNRNLILIAVMSFGSRFLLYYFDLPFVPWQQRFFGCEVMFFILGILSYRLYTSNTFSNLPKLTYFKLIAGFSAIIFAALVMQGGRITVLHTVTAANSLALGLFTMLTIPFIFMFSRDWKFDRLIGEFSYPAYLWHICLGFWLQGSLTRWDGWYLVLVTLLFSAPIVLILELPLAKWRAQRELVAVGV